MQDAAIFLAFYAIALGFDEWAKMKDKLRLPRPAPHFIAVGMALLSHHSLWEATRDFVIHLVVYSGTVFGHS